MSLLRQTFLLIVPKLKFFLFPLFLLSAIILAESNNKKKKELKTA